MDSNPKTPILYIRFILNPEKMAMDLHMTILGSVMLLEIVL